jgi:hypothetical protein
VRLSLNKLIGRDRDFSHCTLHASTNDHLVLLLAYNDAGNGFGQDMAALSARFELALDGSGENGKGLCDLGLALSLLDGPQHPLP